MSTTTTLNFKLRTAPGAVKTFQLEYSDISELLAALASKLEEFDLPLESVYFKNLKGSLVPVAEKVKRMVEINEENITLYAVVDSSDESDSDESSGEEDEEEDDDIVVIDIPQQCHKSRRCEKGWKKFGKRNRSKSFEGCSRKFGKGKDHKKFEKFLRRFGEGPRRFGPEGPRGFEEFAGRFREGPGRHEGRHFGKCQRRFGPEGPGGFERFARRFGEGPGRHEGRHFGKCLRRFGPEEPRSFEGFARRFGPEGYGPRGPEAFGPFPGRSPFHHRGHGFHHFARARGFF